MGEIVRILADACHWYRFHPTALTILSISTVGFCS